MLKRFYLKMVGKANSKFLGSTARTFLGSACFVLSAIALMPLKVAAQQQDASACMVPDSIAVRGNHRVQTSVILGEIGLQPGVALNFPTLQRAIKALFSLGDFDDVQVSCDLESVTSRVLTVFTVSERPILGGLSVTGPSAVSERSVRDKVDLLIGRPLDPAQIVHAKARIDSLYEAAGYYLATVTIDTTPLTDDRVAINFNIDEGRRLAISGIEIESQREVNPKKVVAAMQTRPEGFWFFRKGAFDEDKFVGDLGERIPELYSRLGYLDMRITRDTMIVDRDLGKGLVQIDINEGPRFHVGSFEIAGNRRFPTDQLRQYYPFDGSEKTLTDKLKGLIRREVSAPEGVFDQKKWDDALEKVNNEYRNNGYLYAQIRPVVERQFEGPDSVPTVNLRWEIDERNPAIVNRIDILGNDFTSDDCIRRQIFLVLGGPFNQAALIRSYQSISNMNFFEAPLPFPDYRPINDQGDVDIVFRVKEKRTGSVNFGASMGQGGVGFGGFIGLEQPNLFGLCKAGRLNWQYGRFFNDFTATYQDPALRGSRMSGTVSAYRTQSRFIVGDLGSNIRTGGQFRLGIPVPWSLFSTAAISYSGESATFTSGTIRNGCTRNCFRSNLGLEFTSDTRVDLPFATQGAMKTITVDLSGGPLGGTVNFQRVATEFRSYALLGQFGGNNPGSQPIKLTTGLTARAGALFGNSGPFFFQQQFAVGGVMYGQQLRGYPEFSITPDGFDPNTGQYNSSLGSFGNAFMTLSAEIGLRFNQMIYANVFTDAGNNWASLEQMNPTRMFRSMGFGVSTVTPLGPLGIDMAYGFDRTKWDPAQGRFVKDPQWKFHFRLGQLY